MPVQITHGPNQQSFPADGKTIAFVASRLRCVFNLPPTPQLLVNGQPATAEYVLSDGDHLEFVKEFGQKGIGDVCTKEQFCRSFDVSDAEWEQCQMEIRLARLGATDVVLIDEASECLHRVRAQRCRDTLTLHLNETEQRIVETLNAKGPLTGDELANELKRGFTSTFRTLLAGMVRHGVIRNDRRGYSVSQHER